MVEKRTGTTGMPNSRFQKKTQRNKQGKEEGLQKK